MNKMRRDEKYFIEKRVDFMIQNKLNYFQPTISPAPKSETIIESVEKGLEYYSRYFDEVLLQTKHMGSYCTMYLNRDHSKSYFISRNGYKIDHVKGLHEVSNNIHESVFRGCDYDVEWVLLEAELMPWSTLGKGLISREYESYISAIEYGQNAAVSTFGLRTMRRKMTEVLHKYEDESEMRELKPHERRQLKSLTEILNSGDILDVSSTGVETFKKQLEIFGKEEEPYFLPFNVLKYIKYSGDENIPLNGDRHLDVITDSTNGIIISVDDVYSALQFEKEHSDSNYEGIMVKPVNQGFVGIAPCLKVRNTNYLHITYGARFSDRYNYYLDRRNIRRKLTQSIEGYEVAYQLLNTKRCDINPNNEHYRQLLYKAINCDEFVKNNIDSRL